MPAILCPSCGKLINSEAAECRYCGNRRPGLFGLTQLIRRFGLELDFTRTIVAVCAALYILCLLVDPSGILEVRGFLGILAPTGEASLRFGMTGAIPVFGLGHWWTLITAIYLHGGLLHIIFNTLWIRQLAPMVAELFGAIRLFVIFTVSGAMGFLLSTLMGNGYTLGASGSIFGLLAAAIVYGRRAGSMVFTQELVQWAVVLFVFGFIFDGVDNWAHAGGFAGGWITASLFSRGGEQQGAGTYLAGAASVALTLAAFGLQALVVLGYGFL